VRSKGGGRQPFGFSPRAVLIASVVLLVLIGLGVGLPLALSSSAQAHSRSTRLVFVSPPPLRSPGPEGPPLENGHNLAPPGSPAPGGSVDGIACQAGEQTLFHTHARLTLYVNGHSAHPPPGVGIADPQIQGTPRGSFVGNGACFSWLHTHAADGIIHIESPVRRTFTLDNFFDIWGQPLSASQVGPAKGPVTALVNGKVWRGDPRAIPLHAHSQIQLDVGRPLVGPVHITSWYGL
jgi:hypothetical protein